MKEDVEYRLGLPSAELIARWPLYADPEGTYYQFRVKDGITQVYAESYDKWAMYKGSDWASGLYRPINQDLSPIPWQYITDLALYNQVISYTN